MKLKNTGNIKGAKPQGRNYSNTRTLGKNSQIQMRIQLRTLRILAWML